MLETEKTFWFFTEPKAGEGGAAGAVMSHGLG